MSTNDLSVRHDLVLGSRRFSNYLWVCISLFGGIGFFLVGISTYFGTSITPFIKIDNISFIPQGIVMTFYGSIGLLLSVFLALNIGLNVGGGYNKYNKVLQTVEIFRLGFPLQNSELYLCYSFKDIKSIKLSIKEGLNPKREIYLCTRDQREIPLTRIGEPLLLSLIEEEAVDLASFIKVPVEGL
jgi:hypothetical protein